jgi:hypothetical protein
MKKYLLQGKLVAKPGKLGELTQIMLRASELIGKAIPILAEMPTKGLEITLV